MAYTWGTGTHLHGGGGFALWDVAAGQLLGSPIELDDPGAMEFSPNGTLLAVAGYGKAPDGKKSNIVQVWELRRAACAASGPSTTPRGGE